MGFNPDKWLSTFDDVSDYVEQGVDAYNQARGQGQAEVTPAAPADEETAEAGDWTAWAVPAAIGTAVVGGLLWLVGRR